MDDIGCGIDSVGKLIPNSRLIKKSSRRSGLKLPPEKCVFGTEKVSFPWKSITEEGTKPEKPKIETFL